MKTLVTLLVFFVASLNSSSPVKKGYQIGDIVEDFRGRVVRVRVSGVTVRVMLSRFGLFGSWSLGRWLSGSVLCGSW